MLATGRRTLATPQNLNTEIGLPLTILVGARRTPRCSCWRWRCAALGQIAELAEIAQPDVGVIVNIGPSTWSSWARSRRSPPPRRS